MNLGFLSSVPGSLSPLYFRTLQGCQLIKIKKDHKHKQFQKKPYSQKNSVKKHLFLEFHKGPNLADFVFKKAKWQS
jgi:hypothetical protein